MSSDTETWKSDVAPSICYSYMLHVVRAVDGVHHKRCYLFEVGAGRWCYPWAFEMASVKVQSLSVLSGAGNAYCGQGWVFTLGLFVVKSYFKSYASGLSRTW